MRRTVMLFLLLGACGPAWGQEPPTQPKPPAPQAQATPQGQPAPRTWDQVTLPLFKSTMNNVIAMAKDCPEDKLDYRPHPGSRSMLEEIWHITSQAQSVLARIKGERPDPQTFAAIAKPRAREEFVPLLENTASELTAVIEQNPSPNVIWLIWEANQHYGKMVTMYRVNGLVPPNTRRSGH